MLLFVFATSCTSVISPPGLVDKADPPGKGNDRDKDGEVDDSAIGRLKSSIKDLAESKDTDIQDLTDSLLEKMDSSSDEDLKLTMLLAMAEALNSLADGSIKVIFNKLLALTTLEEIIKINQFVQNLNALTHDDQLIITDAWTGGTNSPFIESVVSYLSPFVRADENYAGDNELMSAIVQASIFAVTNTGVLNEVQLALTFTDPVTRIFLIKASALGGEINLIEQMGILKTLDNESQQVFAEAIFSSRPNALSEATLNKLILRYMQELPDSSFAIEIISAIPDIITAPTDEHAVQYQAFLDTGLEFLGVKKFGGSTSDLWLSKDEYNDPVLSWGHISGAVKYNIRIGDLAGSSQVCDYSVNNAEVALKSCGISFLHGSTYYATIEALGSGGLLLNSNTGPFNFTVDLVAPTLESTFEADNLKIIPLDSGSGVSSFSCSNANIGNINNCELSFALLPAGVNFIEFVGSDIATNTSAYSVPVFKGVSFVDDDTLDLRITGGTDVLEDTVFTELENPTFEWNEVLGATYYNLMVSPEDAVGTVCIEPLIPTMSVDSSCVLEDNTYYRVFIQAYSYNGDLLNVESHGKGIFVKGPNDAPTDIVLSNVSFQENMSPNTVVGAISIVDPDHDTHTLALVSGEGGDDNSEFAIVDNNIVSHRATDGDGLFLEKAFLITVIDGNDAPVSIDLDSLSVAENEAAGATVGQLSTTDDVITTYAYTIVGGVDSASFVIDEDLLKTSESFDYEAKSSYSITVRSTDEGGLSTDEEFIISVDDLNDAPISVTLSNISVVENKPSGSLVGDLSTDDKDSSDTFTYSLAGVDADSFTISGDELLTAEVMDFESKSIYNLVVTSTDSGGLSVDKAITVNVDNINEPPTDVSLSASVIEENNSPNTVIGELSAFDPDDSSFTFSLSGADAGLFTISGAQLLSNFTFDYEAKNSYTISITAADSTNATYSKEFTVNVIDVNESPSTPVLSANSVPENDSIGSIIGTISSVDPENDSLTYSLSGTDAASFSISGDKLLAATSFDFENKSSYSISIAASDSLLAAVNSFAISISNINEPPTSISLSANSITESNAVGATIGTLSTGGDPDSNTFNYSLVGGDTSAFTISGNELKASISFDYETQNSYSLTVRTTDSGGAYFDKSFTISIVDSSFEWKQYHTEIESCYPSYSGPTVGSNFGSLPACTAADHGKVWCTSTSDGSPSRCQNCESKLYLCVDPSKPLNETAKYSSAGTYSYTVPSDRHSLTFKVWGAGGGGIGECGGNSGGSGGYVQGTIGVSPGDTVTVFVGSSDAGSQCGQCGYGAGKGGQYSWIKVNGTLYGGGNGSGRSGSSTGYSGGGGASQSSGYTYAWASGTVNGGPGSGSGINQGNRAGGGGAGYYGAWGGTGNGDGHCTGSGGGGGSGYINGSASSQVSITGNQGVKGGSYASAVNTGDENYQSGTGGANQSGGVVLLLGW
jgi:hypothetical protein